MGSQRERIWIIIRIESVTCAIALSGNIIESIIMLVYGKARSSCFYDNTIGLQLQGAVILGRDPGV